MWITADELVHCLTQRIDVCWVIQLQRALLHLLKPKGKGAASQSSSDKVASGVER